MKKIMFIVSILLSIAIHTTAQTWQWGRRGGGDGSFNTDYESIIDMVTDKGGNVYILGQSDGGGVLTLSTGTGKGDTSFTKKGYKDIVLASYNCSGVLRWVKLIGSSGSDVAAGLTMDSVGNIYTAFNTDDMLYISKDSFTANSNTKTIALVKYDTSGKFKWLRQPNPDTASHNTNLNNYSWTMNSYTTPNGDTYLLCNMGGTGLISGSTNLVVNSPGLYMLKYNTNGVPTELFKIDINPHINTTNLASGDGDYLYKPNFIVTKSKKIIFSTIRGQNNNGIYPIIIGGQPLRSSIFLGCFSPTGNLLWKVENKDSVYGSISGRPYINENKGSIYVCGSINSTLGGDTILNYNPRNNQSFSYKREVPYVMALDTLGNGNWFNYAQTYEYSSLLSSLILTNNGKLYAVGTGATIKWGSFKFDANKGVGFQMFMPSFDANTGAIIGMDSLKSDIDAIYSSTITADNNNNIYVAGQMHYDVNIGSTNIISQGGIDDFFVGKYGTANCGIVPLKMISYDLLLLNNKDVLNKWTTANEINVSRFNIQRSVNGKDWETAGVVMARNKVANEYSFIDGIGNWALGISKVYYRIESVDYDGQKQYSSVKSFELNVKSEGISVYPNPSNGIVHIECSGAKQLLITDYLGRIVKQFKVNGEQLIVDVKDLPKGMYIVQVLTNSGNVVNKKLIIE